MYKKFAREKLSKDIIKQKREYIIKTIIEKYGENVLNSENITSSVIVDMADLISKEFFENAFEKLGIRLIVCYDNSCCKGTRNVKGQEIELNPNDSGKYLILLSHNVTKLLVITAPKISGIKFNLVLAKSIE